MTKNKKSGVIIRNFIFGVEDSLVSTVGLLSGVAATGAGREIIFMTGAVLILVEALSMGVGSFLSEESTEEYDRQRVSTKNTVTGSITMFVSYLLSGIIPLSPYLIFPTDIAFVVSIISSLIALFLLGIISARFGRKRYLRKAMEMVFLGGITIVAGILVGNLVNNL